MKNGNEPAKPTTGEISKTGEVWPYQVGDNERFQFTGLTKREMFAMAAMQGIASNPDDRYTYEQVAEHAVKHADALLAKLDETK